MKRTVSVILIIAILASVAAVFSVSAEPSDKLVRVCDHIAERLMNGESEIDVSEFGLEATSTELLAVLNYLHLQYPDLFFVDFTKGISYSRTPASIVLTITFFVKSYSIPFSDVLEEYNDMISDCIAEIELDMPANDLGRVLAAHRFILQNFEYDGAAAVRDTYTMLKTHTAVCEGYALLFMTLMQHMGFEVSYARSDRMQHVWNLIKLDGSWYHLDPTWDDPVNVHIVTDNMLYTNFMKSDSAFISSAAETGKHYSVEKHYDCTDRRYDDYFWNTVSSPVYTFADNDFWYIGSSGDLIHRVDGAETVMASHNAHWYSYNGVERSTYGYYSNSVTSGYSFSGLVYFDGCLFYNDADNVYCYSIDSGVETVFYSNPDISRGNIYGIRRNGDQLTIEFSYRPDAAGTLETIQLCAWAPNNIEEFANAFEMDSADGGSDMLVLSSSADITGLAIPENVRIYDREGAPKQSGRLCTGDTVSVTASDGSIQFAPVVLKGDVSGDGMVDKQDYTDVRGVLTGDKVLEDVFYMAGLVTGAEEITTDDYIAIRMSAIVHDAAGS